MRILLLMSFFCFHILPLEAKTLYRSVGVNFSVIEQKEELILQLHDTIQYPAGIEFEDSYQYLSLSKPIIIDLSSGGGSVEEGYRIIDFIDKLKREGFTIKTRVQNGRMCGSMCVPVFLSADVREAAMTSAFMFHGVTTGWSTIPDKIKTQELFNFMKTRGLKEKFEEHLLKEEALSRPGEYWIIAADLMLLDSGIITKTLSHHVEREPISMPFTPKL